MNNFASSLFTLCLIWIFPSSAASEDSTFGVIGRIGDGLSTAGDALGTAGEILGVVSFFIGLIPDPDDTGGTKVRIGVNEETNEGWDFEGSVRLVWAFGVFNDVLGSSNVDKFIGDGDIGELTVHQTVDEGATAQFLDILASDDEICISFMKAAATPDNAGTKLAWTGDIGAACGQAWEYGFKERGTLPNGDLYMPACTWMDMDHGDDIDEHPDFGDDPEDPERPVLITNRQMKIDMMAYTGEVADKPSDYYCGATIFTHAHADPIIDRTPAGYHCTGCEQLESRQAAPLPQNVTRPRIARPRNQKSAEKLVVNSRPQQPATKLCNSPTSRGSDFVSTHEGLFCDMDTKTLYPLCGANGVSDIDCFDLDARFPQLRKRDGRKIGARTPLTRKYKKLSHWD